MVEDIVALARRLLGECADQALAAANKSYFKSPFSFVGVSKADVNAVGRQLRKRLAELSAGDLRRVVFDLWNSEVHEEKSLAVVVAGDHASRLSSEDVGSTFERMLEQCRTWDHVDEICIRVVGVLAIRDPTTWKTIGSWARSDHLWTRRASLISHLPSVRKHVLQRQLLVETCRQLSRDKDFFIRKAIGWVLRELSDEDPPLMHEIFRTVGPELSALSRKEATRKLPPEVRDRLLAAGR